jgi:hypothetical protein
LRVTIENTIKAALQDAIPQAQVIEYPDSIDTFEPKRKNAILVGYSGKRSVNDDNGRSSRRRDEISITITFMYQNRRNRQGLLNDLEIAENILSGYKVGTSFLNFVSEDFRGYKRESSRWIYRQTYTLFERFDNTSYSLNYLTDEEGNYLTDSETDELLTDD